MVENDILTNVWPEWHIVRRIGRGSFGVVYEVVRTDYSVESHAAIKVITIPQNESEIDSLRAEGLSEEASRTYLRDVVNSFVSEIQLMESFKGVQNIVSVEDYKVIEKTDEIGWDIYIRMELLTPLNSYISDKILSEQEVIKLGIDICTALELCAKRNVIHRDIKPENIFINPFGDFKLGDFSIARKLENVTGGLSQKGTYNYMAPEIEKSPHYDATVDLYSLGLVLYRFMNKNRLPFLDTERQLLNPNERMAAIRRRMDGEPLPAPCNASPSMAEVILCACSPEPSKRFATATIMKNALMSVANDTYSSNADVLDRTISGRRVKQMQDPDKTTSVRRASQSQQSVQKPANFSQKKNLKLWGGIAACCLVILMALGFWWVKKPTETTTASTTSEQAGAEQQNVEETDDKTVPTEDQQGEKETSDETKPIEDYQDGEDARDKTEPPKDQQNEEGASDETEHTKEVTFIGERAIIYSGFFHTIGLKSDGIVVAVGNNEVGQCNAGNWADIVAISAKWRQTIGLKSDGTVVAVGDNGSGQCNVGNWANIVAISAGWGHTVGLKSDGTVVAVGNHASGQCNVGNWTDIVAISAGAGHTVGLKSDGTVVAVGENKVDQCNVKDWTDIVAISAGWDQTIGLKSDGTVVAVGENEYGQCNVDGWTDIVAISGGYQHTVGLKSDGTVVAVGDKRSSQCNVGNWTDIVAISAGGYHTVGLKSDGTMVAVGWNEYGQCNVADWTDILIPA